MNLSGSYIKNNKLVDLRVLITGGVGVIGSSLVQILNKSGCKNITILDNLSSSSISNIERYLDNSNVKFIKEDIQNSNGVNSVMKDIDLVIHLAANADVRYSEGSATDMDLKISTTGTYNVLEAMRKNNVEYMMYASSSSVYGYSAKASTDERYGPLLPQSLYAASKLSSEALISSFSYMFGLKSLIFRFANITAPIFRTKGRNVIPDFVMKLKENPEELVILGDGEQEKSYLYVKDCINGMFSCAKTFYKPVNIYNLGNIDSTKVSRIAEIVVEELGLKKVKFKYTGGKTGWKGDIPRTIINIQKALKTGWRPEYNSDTAVRISARKIINNCNIPIC